jgi:hypothetical protein
VRSASDSSGKINPGRTSNATSRNGPGSTWTSFNHPLLINSSGGGESVQFAYNYNHERWSATLTNSTGVETNYSIGELMEKANSAGTFDYRHYIFAGGAKVGIYSHSADDSGGAASDNITPRTGTLIPGHVPNGLSCSGNCS